MRLNNTRQALLLLVLFLLSYFSPPSTSSCPQPQFSTGFIPQPTLFLYLSLHLHPSVSPFSPRMHAISRPPSRPARVFISTPRGFTFFFASLYPLRFMSSFTVFILLYVAVSSVAKYACLYLLTHICKGLFKRQYVAVQPFPVYVCL